MPATACYITRVYPFLARFSCISCMNVTFGPIMILLFVPLSSPPSHVEYGRVCALGCIILLIRGWAEAVDPPVVWAVNNTFMPYSRTFTHPVFARVLRPFKLSVKAFTEQIHQDG